MRAALAMSPAAFPFVFGARELRRLGELVDVDLTRPELDLRSAPPKLLEQIELLIAGWGAPSLGAADLDRMPRLRGVVHWAGGVGFLDASATQRGIAVATGRGANGIPVAEFTVAMITLAAKDVFWASRTYRREQRMIEREVELPNTGLYGTSVGIVGASSIGSLVLEMLKPYDVDTLLFDPTVTAQRAESLRTGLVGDLIELAQRTSILSIHAPDMPVTRGMISRSVLAAMPDGATLINTARGAIVDQDALVEELESGRIRAVLDVTEPDVLPPGHPLYTLPNVFLTPHLAGSMGNELRRLGVAAVAEVERFVAGVPFAHPAP